MNKFLMKIGVAMVGIAMAVGVGTSVGQSDITNIAKATEYYSYTFGSKQFSDNTTAKTLGTITWTPSTTWTEGDGYWGYDATKGQQWGSKSTTLDTMTITAGSSITNITSVVVSASIASSGSCNLSVKVGTTDLTNSGNTSVSLTTSNTAYTFSSTSAISGVIKITLSNGNKMKAQYIKQIVINTGAADTLNTINLSAASGGTTALTTATVKTGKTLQVYLTGNYTTAGAVDKTDDATWTATNGTGSATVIKGLITGVTVGSVTISASYGGKSAVSLTLTVEQGPVLTLSRQSVTPFHEKETKNDITITAQHFTNTPTITASSNSANVTASILQNGNLQIVGANSVASNETVDVTVNADDGVDSVDAVLKVYLKAPVFTLSGTEVNIKPTGSADITVTTDFFNGDVSITAPSSAPGVFTTAVNNSTITITPVAEGSGTITVTATDGTITRSGSISVTVADVLEYSLVTDASTLTPGSSLIIASTVSNNSYAMGAQGTNLRESVSVTVSESKISGPSSSVKIITLEGKSGAWYLKTDEEYLNYSGSSNHIYTVANKNDACTWDISISSNNATITPSSSTSRFISYNNSQPRFCVYANVQNNVQLYGIIAPEKEITNSRLTVGTVSAQTGDTEWTLSGFAFEVLYDGDAEYTDVTDGAEFTVSADVPTITQSGTLSVTVTATYSTASKTSNSIDATLTFVDQYSISRLYDIELALNGTQGGVSFDGIYMGESGGGIVIMNGDYGMLVYGESGSSYTAGETYLTVTGTLKNFNYLYEINNSPTPSVTVLTDATRKSHVGTPSTYAVTGSESAETIYLANRKTSLSGTVYSVGGVTTAGTAITQSANNSVYVTVGGNQILLYIKSTLATEDLASVIKVGATITVEGFTTYYKNNNVATFEVMFTNVVDGDPNYHAADFAKALLKLTKGTCNSNYDGVTNNKSTLTGIWTALAGSDHWLKVEANGEEADFTGATASSAIVVPVGQDDAATDALIDAMSDANAIAAAAYRYDYCTAKYELTNFTGRTLSVSFGPHAYIFGDASTSNAAVATAIISVISISAIGGYFFLHKKKEI